MVFYVNVIVHRISGAGFYYMSKCVRPCESNKRAGVAQLVEHQPSKLRVAGSSLVSRSSICRPFGRRLAVAGLTVFVPAPRAATERSEGTKRAE